MTDKHTPGNWSLYDYPHRDADGTMHMHWLCVVSDQTNSTKHSCTMLGRVDLSHEHEGFFPSDIAEAEANARLFCASKRMYELLWDISHAIETEGTAGVGSHSIVSRIDEVIGFVRGEVPETAEV